MACRLDVRKAILDDIHRIFIEGRYTYYRLNENTFRIASQPETAGKSKAAFRAQAKEIAVSLRNRILKQYGTNVSIFITMPEQHWLPIELRVEPTETYIETLFAKIKPEKRSEPISRLAFLQDPALYQQELQEDEPLKMIPYEAWAAQNRAPNPIVNEEGVPMFDPSTSENNFPVLKETKVEQLKLEFPTPIKPGVAELFESNQEFANQIYEALGFNTIKTLSKEDTEKVDKIFKKYPELETLFNNNKELYNSYLKSIFPNSSEEFKGKLFFHGTKNPIEGGKFKISDRNLAKGLWFTKQLGYAKRIESYKDERDTPITYGVVLNISNPKHFYNSSGALLVQRPSDFEKQYDRKNNDAAVFHHPESSDGKFTNEGGYNQIVVFDENQVHIIGDENDINKAKEFLANQITPQQKQQAQQLYSDYLDTTIEPTIEEFKEFVKTKPTITPITEVPDVMASILYQNNNCK